MIPFTTVTSYSVGTLGYLFLEEKDLKQTGRLVIPMIFKALNSKGILNGNLLPRPDQTTYALGYSYA